MIWVPFKECDVYINGLYLETVFKDGTKVSATPNYDAESVGRADLLGYSSTWWMSRDHEIAHTWLAEREGYPYSLTLYQLAHPNLDIISDNGIAYEEEKVLTWQMNFDKKSVPWVEVVV